MSTIRLRSYQDLYISVGQIESKEVLKEPDIVRRENTLRTLKRDQKPNKMEAANLRWLENNKTRNEE